MPNWLNNTLFWTIVLVVTGIFAAVPFGLAMWLGLAWAIIVSAALAVLVAWMSHKAVRSGQGGEAIVVPAFAGLVIGLIAAASAKLFGFIMAVLS